MLLELLAKVTHNVGVMRGQAVAIEPTTPERSFGAIDHQPATGWRRATIARRRNQFAADTVGKAQRNQVTVIDRQHWLGFVVGIGEDLFHLCLHGPHEDAHRVTAAAQQNVLWGTGISAPGGLPIWAVVAAHIGDVITLDQPSLTQFARLISCHHRPVVRLKMDNLPHQPNQPTFAHCLHQACGVGPRGRHRLLDQHMFARLQCGIGMVAMQMIWRTDRNRLHIMALQHLIQRTTQRGGGDAEALRLFLHPGRIRVP